MRKRRQFHCQKCGVPCEIYHKGRKHRILICPLCGVLATNPFSGSKAASGSTFGALLGSVVPGVGTAIGGAAGGLLGGLSGYLDKGQKSVSTIPASAGVPLSRQRPKLSPFEKAFLIEKLERGHHGIN